MGDPQLTKKSVLTAAVAVVLAFGVPEARPQERRWPALFQDTTEVRVVNVDVFVRDGSDRPVPGLGRDDFQLLVDGEAVEISNFYAVEDGRAVSPSAELDEESGAGKRVLRLALFVDNENITPAHRKTVFRRLMEFVLENRRPDVEMALFAHERSSAGRPLVVLQDFTPVAHDLFVALSELEGAATGSRVLDVDRRNLVRAVQELDVDPGNDFSASRDDPSQSRSRAVTEARNLLPQIYAYATERHEQVRSTLATLGQVVEMLAPLPGRKALVYVSDGLALRPGEALFESWADRVEGLTDLAGETSAQFEAERYDTTRDVLELTARANAGRLTLYALDGSPPSSLSRGAAESRGTFRSRSAASFGEENDQDSLILMAERTGGRVSRTAAALRTTLEGVFADFDHHYSLGYAAKAGDEGREREIEVRGPADLRFRWRRSVRASPPGELVAQSVLAALVVGESAEVRGNPLGITQGTGEIEPREGGDYVVPLLVEVPLGNLVLVPDRDVHSARLSLYVAARDEAGRTSEVARHVCPVRIPNSEVLLALGRSTVCGVRLLMRRGAQDVAVAVRDEVADVTSVVRFALDVPGGPR